MAQYEITRSTEEIERVMDTAYESADRSSNYPGMNYEAGMRDLFNWLIGADEDEPFSDLEDGQS